MGTRALIVLREPDNTELAVIYSQWDGYPSGLGKDLGVILGDYEVGNGIGMKVYSKPFANGMADLGLHLICELKAEEWRGAERTAERVGSKSHPLPADQYPRQIGHKPGGYYLYPANTRDAGEEWLYFIEVGENDAVMITVAQAEDGIPDGNVVWKGPAKKLATKKVYEGLRYD